jgi:hypothetical protein
MYSPSLVANNILSGERHNAPKGRHSFDQGLNRPKEAPFLGGERFPDGWMRSTASLICASTFQFGRRCSIPRISESMFQKSEQACLGASKQIINVTQRTCAFLGCEGASRPGRTDFFLDILTSFSKV